MIRRPNLEMTGRTIKCYEYPLPHWSSRCATILPTRLCQRYCSRSTGYLELIELAMRSRVRIDGTGLRRKQPTRSTTFSFINLFKSAQRVSGDKFAHPQEHFLTFWLYIQLLVQCTASAADRCHGCDGTQFYLNRGTGRQQRRCNVPKAVHTVKNCSGGWANLSSETCCADLKRLINEKVVASCWLFTSLY